MKSTCCFSNVDLLGCLSASIKGIRQLGSELALNLTLFKRASFVASSHCISSVVHPYIQYLTFGRESSSERQPSSEPVCQDDANILRLLICEDIKIKPMKSSKICRRKLHVLA